jgi:hypothetical protein
MCVTDQIARMRYQQQMFDMMMLGLRLGDMARILIATTPLVTVRPAPWLALAFASSCRSVCGCIAVVTMKVIARAASSTKAAPSASFVPRHIAMFGAADYS